MIETINGWVEIIMLVILAIIVSYCVVYSLGRIFAKGFLHETDNFLYTKFKQFTSKKVENGTEDEKES